MTRRTAERWIAGAVLASVLLRLRFLTLPLSVDEAGALTVARSWAAGRRLYVETFVDRPQGVILAFQRWDVWFGPGSPAFRALAMLAGAAVVVGAAVATRAVSGRRDAAVVAAWLTAVLSSSAAIEGYTANGELLAGAATVPAMAIGALVVARRLAPPWLAAAGALGAVGLTVKQSGFDVLVALGLWLAVAAWRRWRTPAEAFAAACWLAVGAAAVLGAAAWHGATLGWDAYAYAIYGFRIHARSAVAGPQLERLALTVLIAIALGGPTAVLAIRRVRSLGRPLLTRVRAEHVLALIWLGVALGGLVVGGNYHRHYWIQVTFPAAVVAATALTAGPTMAPKALLRTTALALALPLAISVALIARPSWERDPRIDADRAIAAWVRSHRATPRDDLLPICASVTWYIEADQLPRTPYLWVDHVRAGRGGVTGLVALLDSPARPTYLALHDPARRCDASGRLQQVIDRRYRPAATIDGVEVLQARAP